MNRFFKVVAVLAVALSSITISAQAQSTPFFMYGPTAGANLSTFKITDESGDKLNLTCGVGYQAGAMVGLNYPVIKLSAEALWVHNRMGFSDYDATIVSHNVEIPVLVSIPTFGPLRLKVGPSFNIPIINRVKYNDGYDSISTKSTVGYVAGLGADFDGITVDLRYNGQFDKQTWTANIDQGLGKTFNSKFSSVSISVGYKF